MYEILMVVYLVVALVLIGFILVQQGKGAGMGASFGAGASGTVFGAGGSGNFLTKTTTVLAIVFFGVALGLGNITSDKSVAPDENSLFPVETTATDLPVESSDIPTDVTSTETVTEENSTDLPVDADKATTEPAAEEKIKDTGDKN